MVKKPPGISRVLVGVAATAAVCLLLILVTRQRAPDEICISFQTPFARASEEFLQLREIIDRFQEENAGIRVKLLPDAPREQGLIMRHILAGSAPDILETPLTNLPGLAPKPYVMELGDTLGDSVGEVFPSALAAAGHDGGTYAAPFRAASTQLIYNGSILRRCGFRPDDPLLSNWAELLATCESVTNVMADEGCCPLGIAGRDADSLGRLAAMLVGQTDGELAALEENALEGYGALWRVDINSDAGVHALSMLAQLGRHMPRHAAAWSRDDLVREFIAGRVAMFFGDACLASRIRSQAPDLRMNVIEAPVHRSYASCVEFYGAVITPAARHQGACKKLLAYLCGAEAQEMIMTGGDIALPTFAPVRRDLLDDPWYADHPEYKPFLKALRYPCTQNPIGGWDEVQRQALLPELRQLLAGTADAEAAAKRIEEKGNAALATHYAYIGHVSETTVLGMSIIAAGVFLLVFFTVGHRAKG